MRPKLNDILTKLAAAYVVIFSVTQLSAQAPVANFTGSPLAGCSPLIVNFQDLSGGNPSSWLWDFGNGNTSTLRNPTATYFTPGTYTVSLKATNASGSNTLTRNQYITVYESPTVDFSASTTSGCFPLRVQFTDLSSPGAGNNNISWQWDFGNGVLSNQQNPQVIYNTAGTYTVTLKVTNDKGCIKILSRTNYISVTAGVKANFTHTQPSVCKAPADITFTNTSTGPPTLSYLWDFGDGSPLSGAQHPTHTYTANGTYIVTLVTFSTAGCQDTLRSAPIVIGGFTTSFNAPDEVCINQPVAFTNTSTPAPISANWKFGDGGLAGTINATHTYTAVGSYTVWLYNVYSTCQDSVSKTVNVNPKPVADFTAPVTSRCEPSLTVNFQDLSTGGVNAWEWDFGDGSPVSNQQNPVHTYTGYGSFTVRLIATTGVGCADTITKTNYIIIRRASISIPDLPKRGCVPYTIHPVPVISSVDAVVSYEWDFGDGGTSSLPNPSYTYTIQGTYDVRLIITTSSGCRDTLLIPQAVKVGTKPVADFTAMPIPVCGRQPVFFTDLSVPADEWDWDFGDGGNATTQNPSHSYSDTGYFNIRLIAFNNGCPDTLIKPAYTRVLPPIANFTPVPDCANRLRFSFTDQSIAPLTWEWDFGDGSPHVFGQSPSHVYPSLGAYTVKLIVTNGGCADTITHTIKTIDENPDFTADQLSACKKADIHFTATNINPANVATYTWDFGDGSGIFTVSTISVTHTYAVAGFYTTRMTVTDINGCTDVVIKNNYIRINGPTAGFNATNTNGCAGNLTTVFNDLSVTDGINAIVNWQFTFGDGITQNFAGPPFQHAYAATGIFDVRLIITDAAGCVDSLTLSNLVKTTDPVPSFYSADTLSCPAASVIFVNTSQPAGGFTNTWYFGDGGTASGISPSHSYATTGVYDVKLKIVDANGCADSLTKLAYVKIDSPLAGFTANDTTSSCVPFEVQFNNTSHYVAVSNWDFGVGEGSSSLTNPVHYYSTPGTYQVRLLITSPGGCLDSAFHTIILSDTVGSRVDYLPLFGCKPLDVDLNSFTPGVINSYFWDFGDGNTQTTTTPNASHIYNSFGNFLPKVIMEDPTGCKIPIQSLDTVRVIGAAAKFGVDNSLFCDVGTVNFIDSTTFNDPLTTYEWQFGDGGTSSLPSPSHTYLPGIYTVRLIVNTLAGCNDTLTKTNIIKVVQRPLIDIAGDTALCVHSSLTQTGFFIRPDTSAVSWQWSFPNGNSSNLQNPPAQTYNTPGTFTVTSIATNSSGCKDTTTQNILVRPLPSVTIPGQMTIQSGFPVTIPATYSPNTLSWLWAPATGLSCTTCPTPEAGPKFNTFYQVYFTDTYGCSNIGSVEVIVICKNANVFIPNTFSPNGDGSNDVFYPRGKGLDRVKLLRIFNRWGEVVFEKKDFPINNAAYGWDGTYKGHKPMADVYVYQAELFCENGEVIKLNGNIALLQ